LEVLALHPLFIFKIGFLQSEKGKIYRWTALKNLDGRLDRKEMIFNPKRFIYQSCPQWYDLQCFIYIVVRLCLRVNVKFCNYSRCNFNQSDQFILMPMNRNGQYNWVGDDWRVKFFIRIRWNSSKLICQLL
jgi:hypothetical protein